MKPQLTDAKYSIDSSTSHDPKAFNGKNKANKIPKYLYQDNSLEKSLKSEQKKKQKLNKVTNLEESLINQSKRSEEVKKARIFQEKLDQIIALATSSHELSIAKLHKTAITIQRHVRGFLARRLFEDLYIENKEVQLQYLTNSLEILSLKTFFAYGCSTIPAIIKIQKFYRRNGLAYQIKRLLQAYKSYSAHRRICAEIKIKPGIQVLSSKLKCFLQINITETFRTLSKIRRKLAIFSISKIWKKKKITPKLFKEKILKVKRRISVLKARESQLKNVKVLGKEEISEHPNDLDIDHLLDEDAKKKKALNDLEKQKIRKKIAESKLSYGIKDCKLSSFTPMLPEYSEESPVEKELYSLFDPTIGFLQKINQRAGSLNTRRTQISVPVKVSHKRLASQNHALDLWMNESLYTSPWEPAKIPAIVGEKNFLKKTLAFDAKKGQTDKTVKFPEIILKNARQKYLNKDTVSFSLKRRDAYNEKPKKVWNISYRGSDEYISSVYSATPQPAVEPLRVKKIEVRDSKNINQCSSSVFTNQISTQEASTIDLIHNFSACANSNN